MSSVRLKYSNIRSRPRQLIAYSPTGGRRSLSQEPPFFTDVRPYTFPVEKATTRLQLNLQHTTAGRWAFIAQVCDSFPVEPNFIPAMFTTFGTSGNRATVSSSKRSHAIVSTPTASSVARAWGYVNRETPITRRSTPAASDVRRSIRASDGPIFRATPSTTASPRNRPTAALLPASGR